MIGLEEALAIHQQVVAATGGSQGVRDMGGLKAAPARPYASFPDLCHNSARGSAHEQ